jgi:hypothetical protein
MSLNPGNKIPGTGCYGREEANEDVSIVFHVNAGFIDVSAYTFTSLYELRGICSSPSRVLITGKGGHGESEVGAAYWGIKRKDQRTTEAGKPI